MPQQRLPPIAPSAGKARVKPISSQASQQKRHQQQTSASSHPPLGPLCVLSDSAMTPWGGLALSEASFASIAPPPPPRRRAASPPPPPAPQPTPATPCRGRPIEDGSFFTPEAPSPPPTAFQSKAAGGRELQARRRMLPQRRAPRPPRLPPLRPVTNLSFSRSFTFSFFELPLHQSPCCRAERTRNLMLLLRQIHY